MGAQGERGRTGPAGEPVSENSLQDFQYGKYQNESMF